MHIKNKIEPELYLDFSDVLIKPRLSQYESRSLIDLTRNFTFTKEHTIHFENLTSKEYFIDWKPIPVMSANMDTVTDTLVAFELVKNNMIAVLHKYVSKSDIKTLFDNIEKYNSENINQKIDFRNVFISRGTSDRDKIKLKERLETEPRIKSVCIDVANGYRQSVFDYIDNLRNGLCKDKILMVGNVATNDAIKKYAEAGVDIIKCGIGPGSACTTRVQTGVGVPQISVVLNGIEALKNYPETYLCSDGGCKVYGDIAKAFCAGADFVMIGGMLAGHEESPGDKEYIDQKIFKRFSGMAAKESQWDGVPSHGVEEGKTVMLPYRGLLQDTLNGILGGLRSTCTYTNSPDILSLVRNGTLIRTNVQENRIYNNN
jgi:GMP reductase